MPRPPIRDQRNAHHAVEGATVCQRVTPAVESGVPAGGGSDVLGVSAADRDQGNTASSKYASDVVTT
eukprot:1111579-Pleurochrysis_carterae.AAC.1